MRLRRAVFSIVAVFAFSCGSVCGQDEGERTLGQIYKYLNRELKSRYFANPLLFVGEITALGPVFHGVCKSAVNQTVDFAVSELLLGDLNDDTFRYGYPNCTWQPLPSPPFTLHSQVILFCHHHNLCEQPVPATAERLAKVRAWVAEARGPEENAALAQLKEAIQKAKPLRTNSDLIFEGEITAIEPKGRDVCTVAVGRRTEITVLHVLFGEAKGSIVASYGSVNCPIALPLSVRRHAKVIVYCALQLPMTQSCLKPVEDSPQRLAEVTSWIAQ